MANPGDVVYCDPPYLSGTKENNFTNYHTTGFNDDDQHHLGVLSITVGWSEALSGQIGRKAKILDQNRTQ
jgi:site-specific DNA-adenine methylase